MNLMKLNLKPLSFLRYGAHLRPYRDWFVLLALALAALVISGIWNAWVFYRVASGENLGSVAATSTEAFDTSALTKAAAVFEARAQEAARYRNEYRFVDPAK